MPRDPYLVEPVKTIEPARRSVSELLEAMADTAFQGRALGEAYRIIKKMISEPRNTVFMGLAGSLSTAGMWKLVKWLVENRYIDVLVSTGANISEDILEAMGYKYYKGSPLVDDEDLLRHKIDRFYDTYASELEYREMESLIKDFIETLPGDMCLSTAEFLYLFGEYLYEKGIDSIVSAAYRAGVPVFSPALVDSGYGIAGITAYLEGRSICLDMMKDFRQIVEIGRRSEKISAIYIGGGVPKDYVNLVAVAQTIIKLHEEGRDYYKPLKYVVQITTDAPQWGGLSGATLEEAVSWGKAMPGPTKRTVYCDATVALPLIVHGLIDEGIKRVEHPDLEWVFEGIM